MKDISKVIDIILFSGAIKATKFISDKIIIRAKRKLYEKRINTNENIEIFLNIGEPNFEERKFIKQCKKAKEPFPIKKFQIKFINKE